MKSLDHDVLATVVAIAETGNMSRAAEAVNRSQSAVSMQIKALEESLGRQLFLRRARTLALTHEGEVLLGFARRMLALRDEAWAAVVRPEVTGKVVIGVPDDYASSLLPSVLKKFSASYPKVQIQVMGLPSSALGPLVKDGTVDLACGTRVKGLSGDFLRHEPMAWAAKANGPRIWEDRPLPIAVFMPGSVARENTIRSLDRAKIAHRTSYESPSLLGLLSMVDAGLAIAALAKCAIPAHLTLLGRSHGLPDLPPLELILARSSKSRRPPCDFLAEQIFEDLQSGS